MKKIPQETSHIFVDHKGPRSVQFSDYIEFVKKQKLIEQLLYRQPIKQVESLKGTVAGIKSTNQARQDLRYFSHYRQERGLDDNLIPISVMAVKDS